MNHNSSHVAWPMARHSASALERATTVCFLLFHEMRLPSTNYSYPEVDLRSLGDPAQSASENPSILRWLLALYKKKALARCLRQISQYPHNSLPVFNSRLSHKRANHLGSLTSLRKPTFNNLWILVMISGSLGACLMGTVSLFIVNSWVKPRHFFVTLGEDLFFVFCINNSFYCSLSSSDRLALMNTGLGSSLVPRFISTCSSTVAWPPSSSWGGADFTLVHEI